MNELMKDIAEEMSETKDVLSFRLHFYKIIIFSNHNIYVFLELESVIQQFEFLEEELNIVDNDHSEAMNKSSTSEEFCEKMSSSEPSRLFSEEILQKLETLQNSVQEVNEMFDEPCSSSSSSNSGIYFAQIVYVQWWSWLRIHHLSPACASIIAIARPYQGLFVPGVVTLIRLCYSSMLPLRPQTQSPPLPHRCQCQINHSPDGTFNNHNLEMLG